MISIIINLNRSDIFLGQWRLGMRHPLLLGIAGLTCLYCVSTSLFKAHMTYSPAVIIIALVAAAVVAGVLLLFAVTIASTGMTLIAKRERGRLGEHVFRFTDAGLIESTAVNEHLMKWGGIHSLLRTRRYFYIRVTHGQAHIIPRRYFADQAADLEFWKALQPLIAKKES